MTRFLQGSWYTFKYLASRYFQSTAVTLWQTKFCYTRQQYGVQSWSIDAVCDESSYILPFFFEQQCSATISWGTKVSNILYCTTSTGSSRDANCGLSQIFGKWPVWLLLLQPLTAMEWNLLRHPTKLSTTPPLKLHARMNSSKWLMGFASSSTFISSADFASRPKADWLMTHCIWISPSKVKIFVLL